MTPPTKGISRTLAIERAGRISAVRYDLTLTIPQRVHDPVEGHEIVTLRLSDVAPLILDFDQPSAQVTSVKANGLSVAVRSELGHLVVPAEFLAAGDNCIELFFTAGDESLNRHDDYMYSLFVPARAARTFPCFDQPDIKAVLSLTLDIPVNWLAVSNAHEIGRDASRDRTTIRFAPTPPLPTYLFGFAAGRFFVERGERNGRTFQMYHRESDADTLAANRDVIFSLHQQAVEWLESYTACRYPFEKFDFVLLPAFQFSGMEHPGAIFYSSPAMLLDATSTQDQQLARANLIAHETAHMWFGDLVTMTWFDDVWLKEVFANFMAAKIVNPSFPGIDHELRFLLQHYPLAYDVDRTPGANPIRQTLDNLDEAGGLYGPIIYNKAPIVMRQLEEILGPDALRDGLREYLSRFAFGNATWADLVRILDARTEEDLAAWSHAWIDEPARPTVTTELETNAGRITSLTLTQTDPRGRSLLWSQRLQIALGLENGTVTMPLTLDAPQVTLESARGLAAPRFVLPNAEGLGYGLFKLDPASRAHLLAHLPFAGDAVTRGTAWLTLWDAMLEGEIRPIDMIELALRSLPHEVEEQNVQRMLTCLGDAYWTFLSEADRRAVSVRVELMLRDGISTPSAPSLRAAYFTAFRRMVETPEGIAHLEGIWRRTVMIPGLIVAESDETDICQELALRGIRSSDAILAEQMARITNPDRRSRLAFVRPALSPDDSVRDRFFASLEEAGNRGHEPWVTDAVKFLNHPLRREHAERYIEPGLSLLTEIRRTGGIFFPLRWTRALLNGHNSSSAALQVTRFLIRHVDYPMRLRQIIEQSADTLRRAAQLVS